MDQENVPLTPQVRKRGARESAAPKRVARTYTAAKRGIPFAPVNRSLESQMESLSVRPKKRSFFRVVPRARREAPQRRLTPVAGVQQLRAAPAARLPVELVRQVRAALATESDSWVAQYVAAGGYEALHDRLSEILGMEWREEQHDDQLLHELLRCLAALGTLPAGTEAMQKSAPRPFQELAQLLYSKKRPADLDARRLIVKLLLLGTGLAMPQPNVDHAPSVAKAGHAPSGVVYVLSLLHAARPDTSRVAFLPQKVRPMRPFVAELQTLCAEFFWIFCHDHNTIEEYDAIDVQAATRPRVPSGMTGSVESEAMAYVTMHLRLVSTILEALPDDARTQLCADLEEGGMNDVVHMLRKASTEYYPALHVELARLVARMRGPAAAAPSAHRACSPAYGAHRALSPEYGAYRAPETNALDELRALSPDSLCGLGLGRPPNPLDSHRSKALPDAPGQAPGRAVSALDAESSMRAVSASDADTSMRAVPASASPFAAAETSMRAVSTSASPAPPPKASPASPVPVPALPLSPTPSAPRPVARVRITSITSERSTYTPPPPTPPSPEPEPALGGLALAHLF